MTRTEALYIILLLLLICSCNTGIIQEEEVFNFDTEQVQIVLFHLEQRCKSCTAVEKVTQSLLEEEYTGEINKGELSFVSLNIQSENGRKAAKILKAPGQSLFIVNKDSISDLTGPAFMFANTHPERYRKALRKELENFLDVTDLSD